MWPMPMVSRSSRLARLRSGHALGSRHKRSPAAREREPYFDCTQSGSQPGLPTRKDTVESAWEAVKAYRDVSASKIRYLHDKETKALVGACEPPFRDLVTAALLTGARYG